MQELTLVQFGKQCSVVKVFYTDTKEITYMIVTNDHFMLLDEMGLIK